LRGRCIVSYIVDASRTIETGADGVDNVVNMHAAENLSRHIDTVRLAVCDPLQRRTAGAINAGQAKNADIIAQCLPCKICLRARGAAPFAHGCAFIDPCAAGVTINTR